MRHKSVLALAVLTATLMASVCFALWGVSNEGLWPESWPKALEQHRTRSRTLAHRTAITYEIPFARREDFESAWPHILAVKSTTAPLILLRGPDQMAARPLKAGVRILCPPTGELVTLQGTSYPPGAEAAIPDGKFLTVGPPWPDDIKSESGALPEYVVIDNGKWRACDAKGFKEFEGAKVLTIRRARTEVQLIVDGDVVDLNRIPLPGDTPIIDRRFTEMHNKAIDSDEE